MEEADELQKLCYRAGLERYESTMSDKYDRHNMNELLIEAYQSVLGDKYQWEKRILNAKRDEEYQKNRPPAPNWYGLKDNTFNKECYRNRVALKPNNENSVYLDRLKDPSIYWLTFY